MSTKKEPKEMTVEEKLKTLYQLQTVLTAIDEKRALRGELPLEVKDLEDELEGLNTRAEKINDEIRDFQAAMNQKKAQINTAQISIEKYKNQLEQVKNNREYDMLSKELEYQQLEVQLCEKKIKEAQAQVEVRQKDLAATKALINDRTQALSDKQSELESIMQETRDAEEALKAKARALESKIEPRLLASFKRIRKSARNGLGIVVEDRGACGGCHNKIPPQRQLDIKSHKKVIVCEYCGRIMIDRDLAGLKPDAPQEKAKPKKRAIRKIKKTETTAGETASEAGPAVEVVPESQS